MATFLRIRAALRTSVLAHGRKFFQGREDMRFVYSLFFVACLLGCGSSDTPSARPAGPSYSKWYVLVTDPAGNNSFKEDGSWQYRDSAGTIVAYSQEELCSMLQSIGELSFDAVYAEADAARVSAFLKLCRDWLAAVGFSEDTSKAALEVYAKHLLYPDQSVRAVALREMGSVRDHWNDLARVTSARTPDMLLQALAEDPWIGYSDMDRGGGFINGISYLSMMGNSRVAREFIDKLVGQNDDFELTMMVALARLGDKKSANVLLDMYSRRELSIQKCVLAKALGQASTQGCLLLLAGDLRTNVANPPSMKFGYNQCVLSGIQRSRKFPTERAYFYRTGSYDYEDFVFAESWCKKILGVSFEGDPPPVRKIEKRLF